MKEKETAEPKPVWGFWKSNTLPVIAYLCIGTKEQALETAEKAVAEFDGGIGKGDAREFAERLRKLDDGSNNEGDCSKIILEKGNGAWLVRMNDFDGSVDDLAVLSHECLHAALSMEDWLGIREDPPYEGLCYLNEAVFKSFVKRAYGSINGLWKPEEDANGKSQSR